MARFGFIYIIEGLLFSLLAMNASGAGARAMQLKLSFGWVAGWMWILVPIAFVGVSVPALRQKIGRHQHWVHVIGIACFLLPGFIFSRQTQEIPLLAVPTLNAWDVLSEEYNDRILFMGNTSGIRAIIPRSFDRHEVTQKIFALDPSVDPSRTEQVGPDQPPTRTEFE